MCQKWFAHTEQTEQYKVFNMYTKQNTSQDEIQTVRRTLNARRVLVQGQHTSKDQVYMLPTKMKHLFQYCFLVCAFFPAYLKVTSHRCGALLKWPWRVLAVSQNTWSGAYTGSRRLPEHMKMLDMFHNRATLPALRY
jgi:hypothetical protein